MELSSARKTIGVRQTGKAIREGRAARVYLARNADPAVTEPLERLCQEQGVPVVREYTLRQLGRACGIAVGASAVAVVTG